MDTAKALLEVLYKHEIDMNGLASYYTETLGKLRPEDWRIYSQFSGFPPYESQPRLKKFTVGLSIDFESHDLQFGLSWVVFLGWSIDQWFIQGRVIANFYDDPYQTLWFATEPVEETDVLSCIETMGEVSQQMVMHVRRFLESGNFQQAFYEAKAKPTFSNFY